MPDYSNSHKNREPQPHPVEDKTIEPVALTGEVILKKKTLGQKFKGIFFGGEFKNAIRFVTAEVFLPTVRNLVVDATSKGVEKMVYGESMTRRQRPVGYGSRVQYNSPVQRRVSLPDQGPRPFSRQVRRETNDCVLASREDAEVVLERLIDVLDKYQVATLADLYQLIGVPTSAIDNKWGWTYLNNTEIRQVRDGYLLDLPPVEEI